MSSVRLYWKVAWFSLREEWSSVLGAFSSYLLYPVFVWIFARLWLGLNHEMSCLTDEQLFAYIGLSEILFMTLLTTSFVDRAHSDFALSFIRPCSWLLFTFVSMCTKVLFKRAGLLLIFVVIQPISSKHIIPRFLLFLPLLIIIDVLYSLCITSLQIRVYAIRSFKRLFTKIFLVFGGVFTPFCDILERWQPFFLSTPFSDLIFQPCYYSVMGSFYQISASSWIARIFVQAITLTGLIALLYSNSRKYYHNFGG